MKSAIFLFLAISSLSVFGQLQVNKTVEKTIIGEIKRSNNLIAELSYVGKSSGDTIYTFLYNNYERQFGNDFKSVTFKGTTATVDSLYRLMMTVFKPKNKKNTQYSISLMLGEDSARIGLTRAVGVTRLVFHGKEGFVYLTENEVNKLFGKKD